MFKAVTNPHLCQKEIQFVMDIASQILQLKGFASKCWERYNTLHQLNLSFLKFTVW